MAGDRPESAEKTGRAVGRGGYPSDRPAPAAALITARYCAEFACYNTWQNSQFTGILEVMDAAEIRRERGAFFGSIMGTLNHLLWGDHIWMSRLDGGSAPPVGIAESVDLHAELPDWRAARVAMDARIADWAGALTNAGLAGNLSWYSGAVGREVTKPRALCIAHMFNHQTHHRGQIHAMLSMSGSGAPVSDLVFMPEAQ